MNKLNLAVVGCGYWGPNLVRNFRSLPQCCVKYVSDSDPNRLARMAEIYPEVNAAPNFEQLLEDETLNAIAIATPVRLHFEMAQKSLLAGKHTYIEKPMAASTAQCRELIDIAERRKLTLMVGHTFLYSAPVRKIKQIVESRDLGELLYISSQRLNLGLFQKDINVAWDLAPHDISIILYIMGDRPISVNCQGKAHVNPGVEDVTNMSLNFRNGGFATLHNSWLDPNKVRRMTFVGSRQMLLYDDNEQLEKIKIYDKRVETPPHYDTFAEFHYSYHYGDTCSPYLQQVEPLKELCQHFLDCCIRDGSHCQTGGENGLEVVQVLEAACESLRNEGAKVEIKWD
ncbi:MAG: Gfo/Idh/MocA family protein [Syntrophobacteraceae bacterium]